MKIKLPIYFGLCLFLISCRVQPVVIYDKKVRKYPTPDNLNHCNSCLFFIIDRNYKKELILRNYSIPNANSLVLDTISLHGKPFFKKGQHYAIYVTYNNVESIVISENDTLIIPKLTYTKYRYALLKKRFLRSSFKLRFTNRLPKDIDYYGLDYIMNY